MKPETGSWTRTDIKKSLQDKISLQINDDERIRKNQLDATGIDVILIRLTQHVSGIIMPIVRKTDYVKKLHVVYAWLCWLQSCRVWDTSCVH